ncbi:MAG: glycogen debranching enzyme, partial [Nocardioides sp.]
LHGDELGRTQDGNNNTYAQDSELSWVHWDQADQPLVEFTAAVIRLRRQHPTFQRKRFFTGTTARTTNGDHHDTRLNDIVWLDVDATPMEGDDWNADGGAAIGMYLNGHGIPGTDQTGNPIIDDHFLLYFNAGADDVSLRLPPEEYAGKWDVVIDTGASMTTGGPETAGSEIKMTGRSVLVLREHTSPEVVPDSSVAASIAARAR